MLGEGPLRDWIKRHRVCFEVAPHFESHHGQRVQVGFDLTLLALLPERPAPGDPVSAGVFETLTEIVHSVLPSGVRFEIEPFDASFHLRQEAGFEPEVQLVVEILHSHGTFDEVEAADRGVVHGITTTLQGLGVQERVWRGARGGA